MGWSENRVSHSIHRSIIIFSTDHLQGMPHFQPYQLGEKILPEISPFTANFPTVFPISADPGLCQGRGGAWDHRRCGACFCWLATTLPSARHSGHCPLLLRAFKPASSRHSGHCPLLLKAFKPAVCHLKRCAAASSRHSRHCPLLLRAFKPAVCQASNA